MSRRDPEALRCPDCGRRLRVGERTAHEAWHRDLDLGRVPADTPDPVPDRSWVAPEQVPA